MSEPIDIGTPASSHELSGDQRSNAVCFPMKGIVLRVYPADDPRNRSMQTSPLADKGPMATCDVLVLEDGSESYAIARQVVITPNGPSDLLDFSERLPRGCSNYPLSFGLGPLSFQDVGVADIDIYGLDGSWCIVDFIGGIWDQPFIVRWWNSQRNHRDAATGGRRLPVSTGSVGREFADHGHRWYERFNGVEFEVTKDGHVRVSVEGANPTPDGRDHAAGIGGDVRVDLGCAQRSDGRESKSPDRTFELNWNRAVHRDGKPFTAHGENRGPDSVPVERDDNLTRITGRRTSFTAKSPVAALVSGDFVAGDLATKDAETVAGRRAELRYDAVQALMSSYIRSDRGKASAQAQLVDWLALIQMNLSAPSLAIGGTQANPFFSLTATDFIANESLTNIRLGGADSKRTFRAEPVLEALAAASTAFDTALALINPWGPDAPAITALKAALQAFISGLRGALDDNQTSVVRVE